MVIYKWSKFHEMHPGGETLNALFLPLNVPKANLGSVFKHSFKICNNPNSCTENFYIIAVFVDKQAIMQRINVGPTK